MHYRSMEQFWNDNLLRKPGWATFLNPRAEAKAELALTTFANKLK